MIDTIFKETHKHLKIVEKSYKIIEILQASIDLTAHQDIMSPLQKHYLIIEFTYSYKHFGFSIFAKTSVEMLIKELSRISGTNPTFLRNWLAISSDLILQEISIEKKESLTESNILEEIFSHEFVKRIFCSEQDEDFLTGMGVYPKDLIENIRAISRSKIAKITTKHNTHFDDSILDSNEYFLDEYPNIKNSIFNFLNQLHSDPLSLLSWRLESFVSFIEKEDGFVFILRENKDINKIDSKKIMAVVSLLIPHSDEVGNLLLPHSPISVSQIAKLFSPDFKSEKFQIDILKNWMSPSSSSDGLKKEIESLLETGVEFGLFFKVPNGNKGFSYGLSDNGLKIIRPFHNVLTDTILKNQVDVM
ncbi:hypothetical protein [Silvanigrella aquatica]|uniref:Uncharacterized protein n=1 Tax=Silvanigrella aquatica TaxID=1915309 RepID=A0A1L4D196_9BACT|nr:hypothetical protein [Silvanigrella aquatica]APJ03964.1 hypothetical protein AXG55_08610 [Silvanigrella aquatica]